MGNRPRTEPGKDTGGSHSHPDRNRSFSLLVGQGLFRKKTLPADQRGAACGLSVRAGKAGKGDIVDCSERVMCKCDVRGALVTEAPQRRGANGTDHKALRAVPER